MADITQIPSAKVPVIYGGDVVMTTEWYRYFYNLYGFTGGGTGAIPTNKGGTGQIEYTDGQLLIGNSITKSLDKATITGGNGINVTNGPGSIALSLGGSGVTPGNYGNASTVPQLTVNEYGIISAATNVAIAISASQIVAGIIDPARISGNYSGITGVGTITSGTWQGTTIGVPYGGTGLSSYALGDMLYATGTTALSKLGIGANTYILASTGTAPQWVAPSTISIGTATNLAGGLANQIPYQTGPGVTTFMVAPTVANTYLNWSGSAFQWSSNPLGTVTSVSVVSANGFAGTVATATTTPAITLTTSITGILKGNGTAISAATSGTDYAPATSGTSILYGNGAGGFSNVTIGSGVSFAGGTLSATGTGGTVTSVSGTAPISVATGTTTPVISISQATTSTDGYLSSTDWNTFNGKQAALVSGTNIKTVGGVSLLGSGDVGTIGTAYGGTGLTSFTANRIFYASSTSVIAQSAGLTFDGTNFATTGSATATAFIPTSSTVPTNGMYLPSANTLAWATNSTFRMSLDNTGTLSTTGALSANTTVTAATSLKANLALGSGAGIDTSGQTGIVIAASGNALLISGAAYYLVSIAEVTATGLNGVYVLGNGSVSFLGGIGWVATTTTPAASTFSIAYSGGNYRIYNGFTAAGTYTFKATVIKMS